jgi:hypothetical protein
MERKVMNWLIIKETCTYGKKSNELAYNKGNLYLWKEK